MTDNLPLQPSVHTARWERLFDRVLSPLEEFTQQQLTSSVLLMLCTLAALVLANSPLSAAYLHGLHVPLSIAVGDHIFAMSLHHWINDALMALFFLVVGLELKRELVVGELADWRRAALPITAAIGGMVVPALMFYWWNPMGDAMAGWGIPMATDIAFAVGVVSLLNNRIPSSLGTFLIALAIVDDLGAVLVIALFYTASIDVSALQLAGVLTATLLTLNLGGVRAVLPYLLIGVLLWCAVLASGVHATLAGVILAFTIPIRPKYNPMRFIQEAQQHIDNMHVSLQTNPDIIHNEVLRTQVGALEKSTERVQAPAQRLEHSLHFGVAFLVIPLFALANAAIPVELSTLAETLVHPVTVGVMSGLLLGKWLGIVGASWLALRLKLGQLPNDLTLRHLHGIGLLGGIGFTMSIFVADLSFTHHPELLLMAKIGIILASLLAGVGGYCWLRFFCASPRD
jgi:NhaA family Na+:H+ antiporter